ncbi:Calreticulin family protein [Histomonas meleagridis]|uniref:Calreticulin family protein n=1 Tax=Histomonas meleagridis TaxID=135588 RepID=UPI0035593D56|nr:Calreticulin family protein [Histomonas meleagridis]KAH0804496.1 Calreticulin family protein [Histomonas meleagridis]
MTNKELTYTLIIRPNNKFIIFVDGSPLRFGSLLKDFYPPVNPPREIDDPTDTKPIDWVDDEYVIDETVKKPSDWDETQPEFIPDPEKLDPPKGWLLAESKLIPNQDSKQPKDWDESIFGKWEPELIPNPKCENVPGCGPYEPPLIINPKFVGPWEPPRYRNPQYKGKWIPRRIPNPNFYEDLSPHNFANFTGVGFDLWTIDGTVGISDIIISSDENAVKQYNEKFIKKEEPKEIDEKEEIKIENFYLKKEKENINIETNKPIFADLIDKWKSFYKSAPITTLIATFTVVFTPFLFSIMFK